MIFINAAIEDDWLQGLAPDTEIQDISECNPTDHLTTRIVRKRKAFASIYNTPL